MEFSSIVELAIRSKKLNTEKSRRATVRLWHMFLKKAYGKIDYKIATTRDASNFIDWLSTREGIPSRDDPADILAANSTLHSRAKIMLKIFEKLVAEGEVGRNIFQTPYIELPHPRGRQKRKTKAIPIEKIKKLFKARPKTNNERQVLCVAALLYAGGLRRSEALKLRLSSIRYTPKGTLFLHLRNTKAGIDQVQPLAKWTTYFIHKQVSQRSRDGARNHDRLFVTYNKKGIQMREKYSESTLYRHNKKLLINLGCKGCTPHSFRKTAGNFLIQAGHPAPKVKDFMRHGSLAALEPYIEECQNIEENLAKNIVVDTF